MRVGASVKSVRHGALNPKGSHGPYLAVLRTGRPGSVAPQEALALYSPCIPGNWLWWISVNSRDGFAPLCINGYRMIRCVLLLLIVLPAMAIAGEIYPELSGRVAARAPAGCADYGFLFIGLYRAELWTDAETAPGEEFGLTLVYRREFSRDVLVSTSISEMARMSGRPEGSFDPARAQLEAIMRTVSKGDRFTAWWDGSGDVEFFFNGMGVGVLEKDADLFLDIWLGSRSREPGRRDQLISGRCESRSRGSR